MNPTAFDPTKFGATPIDLATDTGGDTSTFDPTQFGAVPFDASEFGATPMEPEPFKPFRYEVAEPVITPEQKAANFKTNYDNAVANAEKSAKEAKKANSFWGKVGATVKGVGQTLASSEIGLGKSIATIFDKKTLATATDNITKLTETQVKTMKNIKQYETQGKNADDLKRSYNAIQDLIDENKKAIDDFNASIPTKKKVLGQIGGTALDIVTAGSSKAATTEAKVAIKSKSLAPAIKNPIAGRLVKSAEPVVKKISTAVGLPEVGKVAEIADKPAGLFTKKGASTVAKGAGVGYGYDVTEGLQGNRGENREGGKALIPGLGTVFGASIPAVSETAQSVKNKVKPSPDIIEEKILNKFTKGVRPLLPGKTTLGRMNDYKDDVIKAVKTIKDNKVNLKFNTSAGDTVVGKNPRSLQQLSDAIEQTKKTVFREYDALAKKAGSEGVGVEMAPIASELDAVIGNKALAITNPKAIRYAQQTQSRLIRAGKLDAETAQEVVQNYNKSLEAFYRNPSYDTASNAAIDAMLANRVRQSLDDGISGLTGTQYGDLKRKYGSLKAIEKDVIKATLRDARKNTKGLIDFTDIFSGGQIVNGILSLNPATISQGIASKAIAEFYKYINNPNRAIETMFDIADKLPANQSRIGPKSLLQTKPNTSINTTPPIKPNISPIIPKAKPIVNDIESLKSDYEIKLRKTSPNQPESWYKYQVENQPLFKDPEKFGLSQRNELSKEAEKYETVDDFIKAYEKGETSTLIDKSNLQKNIDILKSKASYERPPEFNLDDLVNKDVLKKLGVDGSTKVTFYEKGWGEPLSNRTVQAAMSDNKGGFKIVLNDPRKFGGTTDEYIRMIDNGLLEEATHIKQIKLNRVDKYFEGVKVPEGKLSKSSSDYPGGYDNAPFEKTAKKSNSFLKQSQLTDIYNKAKKTNKLSVTDAYGDSYLGFNIKGLEKKANENGYDLYGNLIKRVDSQDTVPDKIKGMQSILDEIVSKKAEATVSKTVYKQYTPELRTKIEKEIFSDPKKAVIIDTDTIKKLHPDYDPKNPMALHDESSSLSKEMYNRAIDLDQSGIVKLTGGGAGSGKSEVVLSRINSEPSVIFDGTLKDFDSNVKKIDYALSKGKKVELYPVYTPIELATLFNKMRIRNVTDDILLDTHAGFRETIPKLMEKYGDKIKVIPYENKVFDPTRKYMGEQSNLSIIEDMRIGRDELKKSNEDINGLIEDYGMDIAKKVINDIIKM